MRILSLGASIPDQQVDNYGWSSALSFFDYDAIVVDPAVAVSEMIEAAIRDGTTFTSYNEEPVENGPTTATTIGLADLLKRRADETERLLGKGGLVVCFAYPDVPHPRVSGFNGAHRYYWLPAPAGTGYGTQFLRPAEGTNVVATDFEHPFADFFERHRSSVLYRAVFAEGAAGFGEQSRVIARSPGGAALAVDISVGGGRIIFLPALPSRLSTGDRTTLASTIVAGVRNTLLLQSEGPAPSWVSGFSVPGLQEAQARVDVAESKLASAEDELDEARAEMRGLDRYRRMLWQEGKYGLDLPVRDALSLLGMTNFTKPDEPGLFSYQGVNVVLETEGSPDAIGMAPHYRLRQRIDRYIVDKGEAPRGLLVINGQRQTAPSGRQRQHEDPLAVAAETMRYCVLESAHLFDAVRAKIAGQDDDVKAFLTSILETEGVYHGPVPVVEATEDQKDEENDE